ncbi:hypothetical protein ACH4MA_02825 [Streptomyces roseolus]|uniref:hypothetical protein n=1 Tax=Streptomyces roseolus TaxID=67358 RepID=UPI0037AC0404
MNPLRPAKVIAFPCGHPVDDTLSLGTGEGRDGSVVLRGRTGPDGEAAPTEAAHCCDLHPLGDGPWPTGPVRRLRQLDRRAGEIRRPG